MNYNEYDFDISAIDARQSSDNNNSYTCSKCGFMVHDEEKLYSLPRRGEEGVVECVRCLDRDIYVGCQTCAHFYLKGTEHSAMDCHRLKCHACLAASPNMGRTCEALFCILCCKNFDINEQPGGICDDCACILAEVIRDSLPAICPDLVNLVVEYSRPVYGMFIETNLAIWTYRHHVQKRTNVKPGPVMAPGYDMFLNDMKILFSDDDGNCESYIRLRNYVPKDCKSLVGKLSFLFYQAYRGFCASDSVNKSIVRRVDELFLLGFSDIYSDGDFTQPLKPRLWQDMKTIIAQHIAYTIPILPSSYHIYRSTSSTIPLAPTPTKRSNLCYPSSSFSSSKNQRTV
jgi:hypothetical protein